jgi:hypothetical protein
MENPYVASEQPADPSLLGSTEAKIYGGLRRLPYVLAIFGVQLVMFFVGGTLINDDQPRESLARIIMVSNLIQVVLMVGASMLRAKNMGFNAAWGLTIFVPLYNLLAFLRLLTCPEGYADSRKYDRAGTVAATLYCLLLLAFIVMLFLGSSRT